MGWKGVDSIILAYYGRSVYLLWTLLWTFGFLKCKELIDWENIRFSIM